MKGEKGKKKGEAEAKGKFKPPFCFSRQALEPILNFWALRPGGEPDWVVKHDEYLRVGHWHKYDRSVAIEFRAIVEFDLLSNFSPHARILFAILHMPSICSIGPDVSIYGFNRSKDASNPSELLTNNPPGIDDRLIEGPLGEGDINIVVTDIIQNSLEKLYETPDDPDEHYQTVDFMLMSDVTSEIQGGQLFGSSTNPANILKPRLWVAYF